MSDFIVSNHGTIFTLTPRTEEAKDWINNNIDTENAQWFGQALIVEHRYIDDILFGIDQDGLEFVA
jgi:hypothetical protein